MKTIAIAKNTVREVIRDKILYIILIFAIGMMGFSTLLYYLSMRQDVKMIKDIGLGMISIFGVIITIFIGSNMLFKEIDKKTIYTVLSKPLNRTTFLLGKFLGLSFTLFLITFGLSICFYGILFVKNIPFEPLFALAICFSFLEMVFLTAVTIFFSTITSPIVTTFCTLVIFLVGRSTDAIYVFIGKLNAGIVKSICEYLFYLIPNLEYTNIINQVVYGIDVSLKQTILVVLYIFIYTFLLLYISTIAFKNKDF